MVKIERASIRYLECCKYKPDIAVELRPDRKRIVVRQGEGEVWIDCADVKTVCEAMQAAVAEAKLTHVVEGDDE